MYTSVPFVSQGQSEQKFCSIRRPLFSRWSDVRCSALLPVHPVERDDLESHCTVEAVLLLAVIEMQFAADEQVVMIFAWEFRVAVLAIIRLLGLDHPILGMG